MRATPDKANISDLASTNSAKPKNWNVPDQHLIHIEPKRIIGSGSFGYVFEAIEKKSKKTIAIKRTTKAGEFVSREFEVLEKLRGNQHCIQMLDIFYSCNDDGKKV